MRCSVSQNEDIMNPSFLTEHFEEEICHLLNSGSYLGRLRNSNRIYQNGDFG